MNELIQPKLEQEIREKFGMDFTALSAATHLEELTGEKLRHVKKDLSMLLLSEMLRSPLEEKDRFTKGVITALNENFSLTDAQLAQYCGLNAQEFQDLKSALETAPLTQRETALLSLLHLKDLLAGASNSALLIQETTK